jgi:hypothetical protein
LQHDLTRRAHDERLHVARFHHEAHRMSALTLPFVVVEDVGMGARLERGGDLVDEMLQVERRRGERQPARLDPCQVDDVVEEVGDKLPGARPAAAYAAAVVRRGRSV